jgi:cytochrome c oxidase subunit 3
MTEALRHDPETEALSPSEPWSNVHEEREASNFGIWLFLATEMLFFGGLFLAYTVAHVTHPHGFVAAARETDIWFGTTNTVILLVSSLTMVVAVQGAEAGFRRLVWLTLAATAALGVLFLVVKGFEYREDIAHNLIPGTNFPIRLPGGSLFFSLYWIMTGVHALHLTVGIVLVARFAWLVRGGVPLATPDLAVYGLYWHFVDVIWMILYPLLYLVGRTP